MASSTVYAAAVDVRKHVDEVIVHHLRVSVIDPNDEDQWMARRMKFAEAEKALLHAEESLRAAVRAELELDE